MFNSSAGITPAYAGKSGINCNQIPVTGDHPRLCGEKSKISHHFGVTTEDHPRLCGEKIRKKKCVMRNIGSPPPMRGKAQNCGKRRCVHRITPAYAGKRYSPNQRQVRCRDHPRLCGEKSSVIFLVQSFLGSPPPMRGKGVSGFSLTSVSRITPAYAGKSLRAFFHFVFLKDHPRLCGEKRNIFRRRSCDIGSPPPMRGKVPETVL